MIVLFFFFFIKKDQKCFFFLPFTSCTKFESSAVQRISVMAREGQRLMNLHIVTSLIQTAVLTVHRYV